MSSFLLATVATLCHPALRPGRPEMTIDAPEDLLDFFRGELQPPDLNVHLGVGLADPPLGAGRNLKGLLDHVREDRRGLGQLRQSHRMGAMGPRGG